MSSATVTGSNLCLSTIPRPFFLLYFNLLFVLPLCSIVERIWRILRTYQFQIRKIQDSWGKKNFFFHPRIDRPFNDLNFLWQFERVQSRGRKHDCRSCGSKLTNSKVFLKLLEGSTRRAHRLRCQFQLVFIFWYNTRAEQARNYS